MVDTTIAASKNERLIRQLVATTYFLSFFPSLIYFISPTQTQPIAAAVALPLLFLCRIRITQLTLPFLLMIVLLTIYIVVSVFLYPEIAVSVVVNGASYIAPVVLFVALQDKTNMLTPRPLMIAMGIWTAVGVIQAFPVPEAIKAGMQALGRMMLERFVSGPSSETRGYSLLASEPSLSAPTIILMGLSIYFFRRQGKISRATSLVGYAMVAFMFVLNRSGTIGVMLISILLALGIHAFFKASGVRRAVTAASIAVVLVGSYYWIINAKVGQDNRTLDVAQRGLTFATDYAEGANKIDPMMLLVTIGNQRIIPQVLAFGSVFQNYGFGHGIACWSVPAVWNSVQDYVGVHYSDYAKVLPGYVDVRTQDKPQSYAALIASDMGFLGLLVFGWMMAVVFFYRRTIFTPDGDNRLLYLLPGLLWLVAMMTSTMPAPWIMLVYSLHIVRYPARAAHSTDRAV